MEEHHNNKKCESLDKYGVCCYIYHDKEQIIKTRFDDFGKKNGK